MIQIDSLKCSMVELNHQCSGSVPEQDWLGHLCWGSAADATLDVIKLDAAHDFFNL